MAQSTFQGPVKSLSGFVSAGQNTVTNVTASTSLTVAAHAGKLITVNGAAITLTLPLINATASSAATGPGADPQSLNNQGAVFTFFVQTAATALVIQTAAAANLVFGSLVLNIDASAAGITFFPNGTSNYIITLNGSTKGGLVGSYITAQIVNANTWLIQGELNGSGALVTPFSG
tara:strand:+ start:50 stop:574 length:525 start_codon:yes stop_codon:yes gene_type:complete